MKLRWGLGPVFVYESILSSRRWQVHAGRSCFVLVLLAGISCVWIYYANSVSPARGLPHTLKLMAEVGKGFFYALTGIQLALILLAAPAAAAGSLGTDRARATLLQMMVTDLSDTEVVLGTLAARLAPVVALIAAAAPVTALAALLGGIDHAALAGVLVISLALALLTCTLALTLSVWVTKTHEVLMAVYMAEAVWIIAAPIWDGQSRPGGWGPPEWFWKAHPFTLAFAPYYQQGYATVGDFAAFSAGVLVLSAALLGLAIVRLRPIVVGHAGRTQTGRRWRWAELLRTVFPSWTGPSLDGNPVLWREWHRNRPSRFGAILATSLLTIMWGFVAHGTYLAIVEGTAEATSSLGGGCLIYLTFGLLILAATAPTTLAEERTRGSLDVLLVAPLATREIVVAKWWGVYRQVLVVLPLFLYVSGFEAATVTSRDFSYRTAIAPGAARTEPVSFATRLLAAGFCPADFLASGALIVSVGVALATWVRRVGRAIVLSVIALFLVGLVWPTVVEIAFALALWFYRRSPTQWFEEYRWVSQIFGALSPVGGPALPLNALQWNYGGGSGFWIGVGLVVLFKVAVAWLLLEVTVRTFDRCLGRVSESPHRAAVSRPLPRP
jgi:hypothetical protein